jgi:hypothetical protein
MRICRTPAFWAVCLVFSFCVPALAQSPTPTPPGITTTTPELTMAGTIATLTRPAGAPHVGEALGLATQLSIATIPYGASSGGFLIKLDPSTGLQVRTATTFGPAFAERALTSGAGSISAGVFFMSSSLDRLDNLSLDALPLRSATGVVARDGRLGTANLELSSNATVISGRMAVTENLDVGVYVPIVSVKFTGTSALVNGNGDPILAGRGSDVATGLGDITGLVKYRFYSFGTGLPDPGGLAFMATMRLPTGDTQNLRGLGITRTMVGLIASGGQARFRPHVNGGFEYWSKGVSTLSDNPPNSLVTARHTVQYAAGFEFEAAPKVTLLLDLLGTHILGGGRMGFTQDAPVAAGFSSSSSLTALHEGVQRMSLAPGLKANLKGKLLLSVNALIALHDTGLHAKVTPVAGIDLTF